VQLVGVSATPDNADAHWTKSTAAGSHRSCFNWVSCSIMPRDPRLRKIWTGLPGLPSTWHTAGRCSRLNDTVRYCVMLERLPGTILIRRLSQPCRWLIWFTNPS